MYSGSDSTESQKYPQWALNPSAYQNMANDEVDWAALAQQWIIMKEAGPPPIPGEGAVVLNNKQNKEMSMEGGEAPMDVENDKDDSPAWNVPNVSPQITPPVEPWNWNAQNQSWGWNSNWTPSSSAPPPAAMKPPLLPTPSNFNQFSTPPDSSNDNAVPFGSNNNSTTNPPANNDYTTGYWTSNSTKQIKPHNRRFSKVNVPRPVPPAAPIISDLPLASATPTLDAAKRKQLPAWIREGLEKMERDKLKQIEKEREKQERDEYNEKVKQNEKEKMEILRSTMKEQQKSKFESDNEGSDNDTQDRKRASSPEPVPLTHDELMVKVRRTMTQILLNVTNHHIENICKEEHDRYLKKYKASDQRASAPSGANISAKLGLGMYGGDTGSSSDDSHDGSQKDKADSDSELKDTIKRKALEFSKTEREIENKLAQAENRKAGNESRSSTPDTNDNDSQVDARPQGRKQRSIDRTPPHRHDYKKKRSMSSSSGESSSYLNTRSKHRRSSSSNSNDSRRKSKRRYSRSRTPEKKYKNRSIKNNSRRSRSKSPSRKKRSRSDSRSRRESTSSRSRNSRRSRSRSYSRSRRSRSSSFRRSKRSSSRDRVRDRSRSRTSSRYSKTRRSRSRSDSRRSSRRRRSRSNSSSRGKRSHRH